MAYLRDKLSDPLARKLLVDLIGQRSLLTTRAFVKGFLVEDYDQLQIDFIIYSWREAMREGLKDEKYPGGGEDLWMEMVSIFPKQFSGGFPRTGDALEGVLKKFPTKQQLEEAWARENASALLEALNGHATELLSRIPLAITSRYAITWAAFASDFSQKCLVSSTKGQIFGCLKALIDDKQYLEVARLGNTLTEDEVLEHFCLLMTTPERCRNLFWYLIHCNIHAKFLLRTEMRLVREIIAKAKEEDFEGHIHWGHIIDAIILALTENHFDRVIGILSVVQEVYAEEDEERRQEREVPELGPFIDYMIKRFVSEKYTLIECFLNFLRELKENHPVIFETTCRSLVHYLRNELEDPNAKRLLVDLIGQSSLLTAKTFAETFLSYGSNNNASLINFVTYGWREAIANGLESSYELRGGLWDQLMSKFPGEFPEDYPPSEKVRDAVLGRFKTKEQLEETLAKNGDEETVTDELPLVPFNVVSEYAIKWITFVPGSSRKQLTPQASERVTVELKRLFDGKEYGEIARIGNNMKGVDFSRHLCPLITTRGRFNGLFDGLARCGIFTNFLEFGNLAFVKEMFAGPKSKSAFKFFFTQGHLKEAIVWALKEDRHDRAIVLLKVVQEQCASGDAGREELDYDVSFGEFMKGIIENLAPEQDSLPIKRFFTLCGEELKKYPAISRPFARNY